MKTNHPSSLTNGTCGCCGSTQKIRNGGLARHGYRHMGPGNTSAACPGAGAAPLEVSPLTLERKAAHFQGSLDHMDRTLDMDDDAFKTAARAQRNPIFRRAYKVRRDAMSDRVEAVRAEVAAWTAAA